MLQAVKHLRARIGSRGTATPKSTGHNYSWEAPHHSWNLQDHHHEHNIPPPDPLLNQLNRSKLTHYPTLRFASMPPVCSVDNYSFVVFFIVTTCFGLTGLLQVYSLLWLRNMLLTLMLNHNNLHTWRWPGRSKHVVSTKKNDDRIVTDVAHRRHKSKTQSQTYRVQQEAAIEHYSHTISITN
jgi:hypothetical protein